jgi:hypothetical protein
MILVTRCRIGENPRKACHRRRSVATSSSRQEAAVVIHTTIDHPDITGPRLNRSATSAATSCSGQTSSKHLHREKPPSRSRTAPRRTNMTECAHPRIGGNPRAAIGGCEPIGQPAASSERRGRKVDPAEAPTRRTKGFGALIGVGSHVVRKSRSMSVPFVVSTIQRRN